MRTYTIIGGVNGVGKSSFTGLLKEQRSDLGIIIDVDKIAAELGGNTLAGGRAALKKIQECIDKGVSFTQETTLSGRHTEATARRLLEKGYRVRLYYIGLNSAAESLTRIANRVKYGGHDIHVKTWNAASRGAGRLWGVFCRTVIKRSSTTTATALLWWRSTATENCAQSGRIPPSGLKSCGHIWTTE